MHPDKTETPEMERAGHWRTADGAAMAERYRSQARADLLKGDLTDFELANGQYLASRDDLDLIVWQTAAKDRIRWLSAQLAFAHERTAVDAERVGKAAGLITWAMGRWEAEVANRPLVNVHRRTLDDVWRQVLRRLGEDDVNLLGPTHDSLVALAAKPVGQG